VESTVPALVVSITHLPGMFANRLSAGIGMTVQPRHLKTWHSWS